jgi:hypothetical protein
MDASSNVTIPNAPAVVKISRGNTGIRATGGVLFILGGVGGIYLTATNKDASQESVGEAKARLEIAIVDLVLVAVGGGMALLAAKGGLEVQQDSSIRASAHGGGVRFAGIGAAPTRGGAVLGAALQF